VIAGLPRASLDDTDDAKEAATMTSLLGRALAVVVAVTCLSLGSAPGARAAEKVTVGIGRVALMVCLPNVLAKAKGFFAGEGLDVEILGIKGGGSQAASALIGDSVDFSATPSITRSRPRREART
jgi:ABC-type nitrate/sulfonate/bicarbonate transport system substrate-binding protein